MKKILILSASLLALSACSKASDATANDSAINDTAMVDETENVAAVNDAAAMPAVATPAYLAAAGAGDMFEIESSKAVLASTKNAQLKMFAQMMIDQHTESTAKIKAAAKQANLTVSPPKLTPEQQKMLDGIKAASGAERDTLYMQDQAAAHQEALALHQGYASSGDTPGLKTVAAEIVPVVQKHIAELGTIKA